MPLIRLAMMIMLIFLHDLQELILLEISQFSEAIVLELQQSV